MKKMIAFILSIFLTLPFVGCGDNADEIKTTLAPRPLAQRNEILKNLQEEYDEIKTKYDCLSDSDEKKEELKQQMLENYSSQSKVIKGINGEENYNELRKKLEEANKTAQLYNELGEVEKAAEVIEMMNVINYGNKEGKKTW